MSYPITALDGIDGESVALLKSVGIRSTERLLEAARTAKARKTLAEQTRINENQWLRWAKFADLMRVKGISSEYSTLLEKAGVCTVRELKYRNAIKLALALADVNKKHKIVRLLPSAKVVDTWIERARKLPNTISY